MRYAILFASAAALALGACQQSDDATAEVSDAPAADAADTAAAAPAAAAPAGPTGADAAFAAGQAPSREFMVGTWGEGDDCALPINFQADGTTADGPFKNWAIEGENLVMSDPDLDGNVKVKVTVVDANTMDSMAEGSDEGRTLKRC
jgi:hypothetical protein